MASDRMNNTYMMIDEMERGKKSLPEILEATKKPPTLPEIILPYLRDMSLETLAVYVDTSRANIYKIMSGKSHPDKDLILRIAFVLHMDVRVTQQMLKSAHRTPLTSSEPRDVCCMYGLINKLEWDEIDEVLKSKQLAPLWKEAEQ